MSATIEIRAHVPGENDVSFWQVGDVVFEGDPAWVKPLHMDTKGRFDTKKNPFFDHAEVVLFTARRDGQLVGRCSAQWDKEHIRIHQDGAGFFGFFDTIDDGQVSESLLNAASQWLRAKGAQLMRGPFSLSINQEIGLLVDGFEHPPMLMMAHSRPYQGRLAEAFGLTKAKDLLCWRYDPGVIPPRALKAWQEVQAMPEVTIRSIDMKHFDRELRSIMDIYNDAWADNWGVVPTTDAEVEHAAKDLRLIIDKDLAFIAEVDGKPMGMCIALPNLNEVISDLNGRLFPLGFAKMLWRLKVKKPASIRLMMLGIRKEIRHVKKYGGLSHAMYVELTRRTVPLGYQWGELSWTLEDNTPVNLGIKSMGGKLYKTYRVYEKVL